MSQFSTDTLNTNNKLAFPADIGRKPASPVRGIRQCVHAGENQLTAQQIDARMERDRQK